MTVERIIYRVHAVRRMAERRISTADVAAVLQAGETIEDYPDDHPYPSRLTLGFVDGRPLHVVAARDSAGVTIVITVYEPDRAQWDSSFKKRMPS